MKGCVYWVTYSGDRHPKNYIGSTYLSNIENGYLGTTSSKKWKKIVTKEQAENPHLYSVHVIQTTETREDALILENIIQKMYDVVKSEDFWNMSLANKNGCFGMDVSGENNPTYGKHYSKETKDKIAEKSKTNFTGEGNPTYGKSTSKFAKKSIG